jgi:hypothetical protein
LSPENQTDRATHSGVSNGSLNNLIQGVPGFEELQAVTEKKIGSEEEGTSIISKHMQISMEESKEDRYKQRL